MDVAVMKTRIEARRYWNRGRQLARRGTVSLWVNGLCFLPFCSNQSLETPAKPCAAFILEFVVTLHSTLDNQPDPNRFLNRSLMEFCRIIGSHLARRDVRRIYITGASEDRHFTGLQ